MWLAEILHPQWWIQKWINMAGSKKWQHQSQSVTYLKTTRHHIFRILSARFRKEPRGNSHTSRKINVYMRWQLAIGKTTSNKVKIPFYKQWLAHALVHAANAVAFFISASVHCQSLSWVSSCNISGQFAMRRLTTAETSHPHDNIL